MTQANPNHSITAPAVPTRRRFLSNAVALTAGGTGLALASIGPLTAAKTAPVAPRMELDASKASPALRTAITALNESFDRLKSAKARFNEADMKMVAWSEENPEPAGKRAYKRWSRRWRETQDAVIGDSWDAQLEAEEDFRKAQVAVANVAPRDYHDIMVKAATSVVYDRVNMARYGSVAIIGYSVANDLIRQHMGIGA